MFAFPDANGAWILLTTRLFLARVNAIATLAKLPRVTGHCFRIGGTTELLRRGVPLEIVQVAGRWASDSFYRYWRLKQDILPQHIQDVVLTSRDPA
jgi:integrase